MNYIVKLNDKPVAEFTLRSLAEAFVRLIDPFHIRDTVIELKS